MKIKTISITVILVTLLGTAYIAYSFLAKNYKPATAESDADDTISSDASAAQSANDASESNTDNFNPAPDFTVTDAQGNSVKLSDFIGKPIVLNFWTSWCSSCKSEMPHFNELNSEYKDSTVFLMVDLVDGQRETQAKGLSYIEEQGYTFPVYFDKKQSASDAYSILYIPTTIFIDAEGNIVKSYQGAIDKNTLIAGIEAIQG